MNPYYNNEPEKRTKEIKIKLTPSEYEQIKTKATENNIPVSAFIRRTVFAKIAASSSIAPKSYVGIFNIMNNISSKYSEVPGLKSDLDLIYLAISEVF